MGFLSKLVSWPVLAGLSGLYALKVVYEYLRLSRFKGPRWTGVSNWPHSLGFLGENCHEWYAAVNNQYGPIARVAPSILITSSPEIWSHVNRHPGYKRSDWYYRAARIEYQRDNVFSQTDNQAHDHRRKQMMPGYSGRENLDLEPAIDECVSRLIRLIRSKYVSSPEYFKSMDLAIKIQYLTLDVISSVGLGRTFGMLTVDQDVDNYIKSTEQGLATANTALALGFSWVAQANFLGRLVAPSPKDSNGFGKMMAACFRYVDERAASPTDKRSDMLASFIRHGLSGDELRSEAVEQILAGSDTTAGGIRSILLHIMTHPTVYRKLQHEVDQAQSEGVVSAPVISFAEARKLPYLQAVIREALRVWPPVVNIFSRDLPPEGDEVEIDGERVFIPGGVCIGYSAWAMHRNEEIYGADATVFRPERWFETDETKLAVMTRTNDLIFGHGRFGCLGKPVAQLEMSKVVYELMRNFDMVLINPTNPWKTKNHLGLFAISDMWVQVTARA